MTGAEDARFMALALGLAARGLGNVWPNPAVGCVLVNDGRIVGRGWTQPGGRPHAEAVALARAGAAARGATAYVTLEPCAHHGKTPPCAEALAAAGVLRVVSAMEDPDPRVAGRGHAILARAGIAVAVGVGAAAAERLQRGFLNRVRLGRPMLTVKLAASLDGRIATASGESRWITGPEARHVVHHLRARHDAVLVGAGTARADDPALTVRGLGPLPRPPVRIVAARTLDLSPDSALGRSAAEVPLWLVHGPGAPEGRRAAWAAAGARLVECAEAADGSGGATLDPGALLAALAAEGLTRVFCEGGGRLAAAFLSAGLADDLAFFSAGLALGADGTPAVGPLALARLADAPRYRLEGARAIGADLFSLWTRG